MFDLSLFKNISYTVFCISNFLLYACVDIPYVYLPDQAITSGSFDKEGSAKLISIIGFVNTLGVVRFVVIVNNCIIITFINRC